ncbi:protein NATD1 isoform X2 [Myxocyprinus asiaticus]|uniref:protein NATD1 isoform X2 n=1 Tax=Myxocyprinus asiaticus TaxID=70543 RepID=UPI002221E46E|nr:protein NATD1 isoform X2 [Myxocyprinus asiaticus]
MARHILSQQHCMFRLTQGYKGSELLAKYRYSVCTRDSNSNVIHDRQNQRFTVTLDCDGVNRAELKYTLTHDKHVALMSTEVPESHRGKGVAAHLAKAALDFVVKENFKASIYCWYIRKYVHENPHLGYQAYIEDK